MKKISKTLSLFLAVLMAFSVLSITAFAEGTNDVTTPEDNSITVKMINYNVAGMPDFSGKDVPACQKIIGKYIVDNGFDIVATQEDFGYHDSLVSSLDGFNYFTNHSGSLPGGDGLNIFTKTMPIYNEKRETWQQSFGSIAEGDTLTPKGLLYAVIEIGDGIYVDFYDIHADAFATEGSIEARYSNYMQVATMIEQNYEKNNRPVILTGDFNAYLHNSAEVNSHMYEIFHETCGLKDAWVETTNDGNYTDFSKWYQTGISYWGNWDSVEKFLYKDGGGVTVEAIDFNYSWIKDSAGADISDHAAAECTFKFTKTESFTENTQELTVTTPSPFRNLLNMIRWIFKDLIYILSNFDEVLELIG